MNSPSHHPKRPDDLAKLVHEKIDGATVPQLAMIGRRAIRSIAPQSFIPQWEELWRVLIPAAEETTLTDAQVITLRTRTRWALAEVASNIRNRGSLTVHRPRAEGEPDPFDVIHRNVYDAVANILDECIPPPPQTAELPHEENATLAAPCPVISFSTA